MRRKSLPVSVLLCALISAVASTSNADVLSADSDTYVSGHEPTANFGTSDRLIVRSYDDDAGTLRALAAYVRFDLSAYVSISNDASFSLTAQTNSHEWSSSDVEVYGLPAVAGLTGQEWDEGTLAYGTTGIEWANPAVSGADPFNSSNLVFLGNLPAGGPGDTVTFNGAALDAFLHSRAGQGATLLLVNPYKANRQLLFHSSEAMADTPALVVEGELLPQPPLSAQADTYVSAWGTDGSPADVAYGLDPNGWMTIRSRTTAPTYRMQVCYIRFDLTDRSALADARLVLTELDESSAESNPGVVYGLPDVAGLTPQNWSEASLTYNTTGDELMVPFPTNSYPLVTSNLVNLGVLPDCSGVEGNQIEFSSAALDAFLETRLGGTATILLAQTYGLDRQFAFATRESTRPGVEPAKLVFAGSNATAVDYNSWIAGYSIGSQTNLSDDVDGDRMDNLVEYALGGDPTTNDAAEILPVFAVDSENGLLSCTYSRRRYADPLGLSYAVKQTTNLPAAAWATNGVTEAGAVVLDAGFEEVTATVPMDTDEKFLKLEVGCNRTLGSSIPGAKDFHFTFEDIQTIGHQRALPFIDSEQSWTINGAQYPKSRSLNAFDHGLVNDPDEDQTDQINQLIRQASEDPDVDTVYFPEAVYYVSGHIYFRPGVNIVGAGQGLTVLERRDDSNYLVKGSGDFEDAVVANLTLDNTQRTLLMTNSGNLNFFHVEFKGGIVRFEGSTNLVFEGNVFNENIGKAGYASSACKNVRIVNNTINSIEKGGLNLSGHDDSYVAYNYITSPELIDSGYAGIRLPNSAKNNLVEYNYIQNHGRGLFVLSHSTGNTVRFNLVDSTMYQGVLIQGPTNIIKGNVVKDAGAEAIYVINGEVQEGLGLSVADGNQVVDNIVYDTEQHDDSRNIGLKIQTFGNVIERNIVSVKYGRTFKNIKVNAQNTDVDNIAIE